MEREEEVALPRLLTAVSAVATSGMTTIASTLIPLWSWRRRPATVAMSRMSLAVTPRKVARLSLKVPWLLSNASMVMERERLNVT